jgi:hypothetical protein
MSEPITYAKAGGPPDDWHGVRIFWRETGHELHHVVEVNAEQSWAIVNRLDEAGLPFLDPATGEIARVTVYGALEIRRPA